eukprot:CAMPEP_0168763924 /NCGR_PEP_ID=MMETSP0724-20121128/24614_1 /TAXON_ID=265536 /ORGANISM="Amphiprora sp., Strain CCMP467" /LENGTH=88 /DNA_ID=CAMNT_0008813143 /DNA_START=496 /DNA_END=762 /DNA_ORIENTATION=-
MLYSRGIQIWENYQVQQTGAQSGITLGLNTLGLVIRIYTTVQEVGYNMVLIAGYTLSLLTNGALLAQVFVYRSNTLEFLKSLKAKKKD